MKPYGTRGRPLLPLTLHQRRRDRRFDDQVLGRWRGVTGGGSVRACATAPRCDTGKSIPAVTREVPTASPSDTEKTFSIILPTLAFFIICSFASTSASSVLTFSDDVNTRRPTSASSTLNTLDLRNWSYTSHRMLSCNHCSQIGRNIW